MKLYEILSKPINDLKVSGKKPAIDILSRKNFSVLGSGYQATAYLHKKFPGKAIISIQVSGPEDPHYQFLRLCLKHQDNPYLPKIFAIKQYKTKDTDPKTRRQKYGRLEIDNFDFDSTLASDAQEFTLFVVMEKLHKIKELPVDILDRINITPTIDDIEVGSRNMVTRCKYAPYIMFAVAMKNKAYRQRIIKDTTDPKFREVMRLLEPLFSNYFVDLHLDNMMMRGTDQIVITDPISPNWTGE